MSFVAEPIRTVRPSMCAVIPMWNKAPETMELAEKAVASLLCYTSQAVDLRLVVVDNASPYPIKSRGDWDLVSLKKNRGFGPAVNLGAKVCPDTDYVLQMNSDCELVEDSVSILIEVMEKYDLSVAFPEHYENCKHYGLDKSNQLMGQDWRFGAFWIARRAAWDVVGGFDESFEMCYFEDTDIFKRIEQTGRKLAGWRGTWVKHRGGSSSLPERDYYFHKNRKLYEDRWCQQ